MTLILILCGVMKNWRCWVARVQRNRNTVRIVACDGALPYCDLRVVKVVVEVRLRDEHVHLPTLNDWVPRASCPHVVDLCLALPLVTCNARSYLRTLFIWVIRFYCLAHVTMGTWLDINIAKWGMRLCQIVTITTVHCLTPLAQQDNVMCATLTFFSKTCNVNIRVYWGKEGDTFYLSLLDTSWLSSGAVGTRNWA